MKKFDFAIIGNSAGGIACLENLRTLDRDAPVSPSYLMKAITRTLVLSSPTTWKVR